MGLLDRFPEPAEQLLDVKATDFVERLGLDAVREIVLDVLCGINVRGSTEHLTRRRIALLSAGLLIATLGQPDGQTLPDEAEADIRRGLTARRRRVALWAMGLTGKQWDNVLRSDQDAVPDYVKLYKETIETAAKDAERSYGALSGSIVVGGREVKLDWRQLLFLLSAIGSQALAIRGSEKSLYGKLFEKLVLGATLTTLGFELVAPNDLTPHKQVFWLSSRGEKRESDATALLKEKSAIRIDIGFIGKGNPEISLDKVSRFERVLEHSGEKRYVKTLIIVDRIGEKSGIIRLAEGIEGAIIEMSKELWPRTIAEELSGLEGGFESPFEGLSDAEATELIRRGVADAPLERMLARVSSR